MGDTTRPLHAAAYTGAIESIRALVGDCGVDVDETKSSNGYTALHFAAQEGHKAAVETLLLLGANKRVRNNYGETAQDKARANGHFDIASILA